MQCKFVAIGLITGMLSMGSAQAQDLGITLLGGTTGLGVGLNFPFSNKLNGRIGINYGEFNGNETVSDVNYDYRLKTKTADALLDFFPSDSTFRITGGIVFNGNKANYDARPAGSSYEFNGTLYTTSSIGSVKGTTDFREVAPYLGVGWGKNVMKEKGWTFAADLGVLFQGSPRTTLRSTNCNLGAAACAALQEDLNAEAAAINEDSRDYRYYPVLRFGAAYKF